MMEASGTNLVYLSTLAERLKLDRNTIYKRAQKHGLLQRGPRGHWCIAERDVATVRDMHPKRAPQRVLQSSVHPSVWDLGEVVYELTGVPLGDVLGKDRSHAILEARVTMMALLHVHYGWIIAEIARALQRDHSTVYHHLQRYKEDMPAVREIVEQALQRLAEQGVAAPLACTQAPMRVVEASIAGMPPQVRVYVDGVLLARTTRYSGPCAARGLMYLADQPQWRQRLSGALARVGLEHYVPIIAYHARRYGYALREAV